MFGAQVIVTVCDAALLPVPPQDAGALMDPVFGVILTCPVPVPAKVRTQFRAAATYGPTKGPPLPIGAAPAGFTEAVDVSPTARARLSRPLPVSDAVPA